MLPGVSSKFVRRLLNSTAARSWIRKFASESVNEDQALERSINSIQLLGRVGMEPQKRGTDEHPVVVFSLATHNSFKSKSGQGVHQTTDWHRICVFKSGLRDLVYNFLKKGQRVYVTGKVNYGEVPDSNSNAKIYITSIIADDIIFFVS